MTRKIMTGMLLGKDRQHNAQLIDSEKKRNESEVCGRIVADLQAFSGCGSDTAFDIYTAVKLGKVRDVVIGKGAGA